MITATITEDGIITLYAYGNDADNLKKINGKLNISTVGDSINRKTGRKHHVVTLNPVEEDIQFIPAIGVSAPKKSKKKAELIKEAQPEEIKEDNLDIMED